jgi:hypothetical protein
MSGMLIVNHDTKKIFVWGNRFSKAQFTNSGGSAVTLPAGRLLGRIGASQKVLPHVSTAEDGSEQPIGVLGDDYTVAAGATIEVTYCDGGDVAEEKIILGGSDTLSTLVDDTSIRDAIARNSHIKLVASTDLSGPYDNQ